MAISYRSCSCRGRMLGLQAALRPSTTHGPGTSSLSPPIVLPFLNPTGCGIRPSLTQSVLALARFNQIVPCPPSFHVTGFPTSTLFLPSRATTPAVVVQCSTMPWDMENRADVKLADASGMANNGWKIKMLYDGDCPLCMREAMGRIHAIRKDGEVLTNIAAFRALYEEVGLGWVYAITYHQPWASILDTIYDFWAKYRLPITGRPALAEVLKTRRQRRVEGGKINADEKRCRLD